MSKQLSPKKSKRVKWVQDDKLCQVKLFLSEDCPSEIGSKAKNHLQAKTSLMFQSDDPPPGFGGNGFSQVLNQTCVPQIKWKCPPKFILKNDWHVAAGELSKEIETQKDREIRVLEAVYPRPSAIPPSPSVSPGSEECDYDDRETPLIPIIPFEEEDAVDHESLPCSSNQDKVVVTLPQHIATDGLNVNENSVGTTCLEPDIVAAAIMKSSEIGSLIDTDLLMKILSDPNMVESLLKGYEAKPGTSSVPSVTQDCHRTMFQKPLNESSNMHNVTQQTIQFASNTTQALTLPSSNFKPFTALSLEQADVKLNQFYKDPKSSSSTSFSMSAAPDFLTQPNHFLQNPINLDLESSQPSLQTTMSLSNPTSQASMSPMPCNLLENYRPELVSPTLQDYQSLPPEIQSGRSSSQYSSSLSDRPIVSSAKTPVVKDTSYYKSLIELHGTERQGNQEEDTQQYISRASDSKAVSGKGDARAKIPKQCKFFNSSQGCRKGSSCPFQHDSLPMLRAGSLIDTHSSKRLKRGRELT